VAAAVVVNQSLALAAMDTQIVVALVGGGFAVLVALIGKINHDNKRDHGIVHRALGRIEEKIDGHVKNHK
jgi:hypothetical protein